ncbi:MAG: ribonuclease HI family protein [Gemmataceae bacterium]
MPDLPLLSIHTDGASRGNPGEAAFAYTIARDGDTVAEEAGRLGQMTNNQAEYTALVRALEHALRLGAEHRVLIHSDSELMVKQMRGEYKVKNEDLRGLYDQARRLVHDIAGLVTFKHVRRELNKRADELCNMALDGTWEPSPEALVAAARGTPPAVPARPKPAPASLAEEAIALLRQAQAQPSAEAVWRQLAGVLERHGVDLR